MDAPSSSGWKNWRIIVAFWLLGMCNNYIYGIMLSAAHDVITKVENSTSPTTGISAYERECNDVGTGAILLADIGPNMIVAIVFPFLPFLVHVRMGICVLTGILALVLVGIADSFSVAIIGVCLASFNSGTGEVTLLAYATLFPLAVAAWSSGTGGAGLVSSFAYAGMTEGGLTPETSLFISIVVPFIFAIAFWIILKRPDSSKSSEDGGDLDNIICEGEQSKLKSSKTTLASIWASFVDNFKFIPKLLPFMLPLGLVYYFEYLINSALFELFIFENTSMSKSSQFRWFNAMYQIGVFVSRSSVTWIQFQNLWIMAILQAINLVVLTLDTIYGFIPNVWIMFVFIFWEGLLGGVTYVNTFHKMSYKISEEKRIFSMSIGSTAITVGIVLAGLTSLPVHESICKQPYNPVFRWPS